MDDFFIASLIAIGATAWLYAQMKRRTLDPKTSWIFAIVGGLVVLFVSWSLIGLIS